MEPFRRAALHYRRRSEMPLTWHEHEHVEGDICADHGRGRYSVHLHTALGFSPWYVARWHRSQRPQNRGDSIGHAETLETAKELCERHARRAPFA
jgi:hypothetical protein